MEKEFFDVLTLIKQSCFDDKSYYIFMNEKGDFISLETERFNVSLEPGNVVRARLKKRGCSGREITELIVN